MSQRLARIIFPVLLTITLFSLWAGFALMIVNRLFYKDLPGYTIGRLCIWEFVAVLIAALIAKMMIKKWGNLEIQEMEGKRVLLMDPKFGIYFSFYFLIAIVCGIWQFYLFSLKF